LGKIIRKSAFSAIFTDGPVRAFSLARMKDVIFYTKNTLNLGGHLLDLAQPAVMGILNVTPDSFHDGGRYKTVDKALAQAEGLLAQGAALIDVGGYSTRPGAPDVTLAEELARVVPVIKALVKKWPGILVSVDTFRAEVARRAVEVGAGLVNDISGGQLDPAMWPTVAELKVGYVLMHTRGTPQTMTQLTHYEDILSELLHYFQSAIAQLQALGCCDIVVDPGLGFAKTAEQSHFLLHHLHYFKLLHQPVLVGLSRKSMIYKKLGGTPETALNGTTALHAVAVRQGAAILRAHDVREAAEVIKLLA
jgi:dihydropteroate synthase